MPLYAAQALPVLFVHSRERKRHLALLLYQRPNATHPDKQHQYVGRCYWSVGLFLMRETAFLSEVRVRFFNEPVSTKGDAMSKRSVWTVRVFAGVVALLMLLACPVPAFAEEAQKFEDEHPLF